MIGARVCPGRLTRRKAIHRLGVTGAALIVTGVPGQVAAQEGATPPPHSIVGVWKVTAAPPGPPFGLAAYRADGTMSFATPSPFPAPPGAAHVLTHQVPAFGMWEATGERTAAVTGVHMDADEQGTFLGTLTFHAHAEVTEAGDAYDLSAVVEIADPSGAVTASFPVSARATRLRVQASPSLLEPSTPTT